MSRKIYDGEDYVILAARLSPDDLECIHHCTVHGDSCPMDGECSLQERVADMLAEEKSEVTE